MIRPFLAAAVLLVPTLALANGNNLTMTGATYDTSTPLYGTGALSGGYGLTPAGSCYNNPSVFGVANSGNPPPGQGISFAKVVWVKAPTTAPSSDQLIVGDAAGYICVFRRKAASDSDRMRPLIPTQGGH